MKIFGEKEVRIPRQDLNRLIVTSLMITVIVLPRNLWRTKKGWIVSSGFPRQFKLRLKISKNQSKNYKNYTIAKIAAGIVVRTFVIGMDVKSFVI